MVPAIKTYKIDYEFIIQNYTNPKLWDKIWTLLEFKKYVFTLMLDRIDVRKKQIYFEIKLSSDLEIWSNTKTKQLMYDIKNMNVDNLKHLINCCMKNLIELLEVEYIENEDDYHSIENSRYDEQKRLREIAENFLDENNVTNSEIRDVYIDYYVDNNETIYDSLSSYKDKAKYSRLVDLYLVFAEITKDEELKSKIIESQDNDVSEIVKDVENFMEYLESEEYTEEMQDKLEGI